MSYDYGPLRTYEVIWKSGHIETVQGHQVTFDSLRLDFGSMLPGLLTATSTELAPRFYIHGSFEGRWRMVLTAPEAELVSIRDVTDRDPVPEGEPPS